MICPECRGSGRRGRRACQVCGGHGEMEAKQTDTGRFVCQVTSRHLGLMVAELEKHLARQHKPAEARCLARMIARARAGEHPGGGR